MDLTEDAHAFLHGLETTVPGSCLNGRLLCGNQECKQLEAKSKMLQRGSTAKVWNAKSAQGNGRVREGS